MPLCGMSAIAGSVFTRSIPVGTFALGADSWLLSYVSRDPLMPATLASKAPNGYLHFCHNKTSYQERMTFTSILLPRLKPVPTYIVYY